MTYIFKPRLLTRYFNTLIDHGEYYEKQSSKKIKLKEEFEFFINLPGQLREFYPEVHTFEEHAEYSSYMIRKIDVTDCSFMMLDHDYFSEEVVSALMLSIDSYLEMLPSMPVSKTRYLETVQRELLSKNVERVEDIQKLKEAHGLNEICHSLGVRNLDGYLKSLNDCILNEIQKEACAKIYLSHGDMCFSNILFQNNHLYLIDPKGSSTKNLSYRFIHYELSKLSQSLYGRYDQINHEQFTIIDNKLIFSSGLPNPTVALKHFEKIVSSFQTNLKVVRLIEASLFLSLIPFHKESDKKMRGFLINSISIYKAYA